MKVKVTKICVKCGKRKNKIKSYWLRKQNSDGYCHMCKECSKEYSSKKYKEYKQDPEFIAKRAEYSIQYAKKRKKANPVEFKAAIKKAFHKWIAKPGNRALHNKRRSIARMHRLRNEGI